VADATGAYEAAHEALTAWFHGSEHYPYAATGHGTDPDECWQCHEAARVAVDALAKPEPNEPTAFERLSGNYLCCTEPFTGAHRGGCPRAKPDPKSSDAGSALVSLLLAVCIVGGLLGLLLLGQAAMCAMHTTPGDRPIYCESAEAQR
jgi:hypothetical protein